MSKQEEDTTFRAIQSAWDLRLKTLDDARLLEKDIQAAISASMSAWLEAHTQELLAAIAERVASKVGPRVLKPKGYDPAIHDTPGEPLMKTPLPDTCATCRYYDHGQTDTTGVGRCRRHAPLPRVIPDEADPLWGEWPVVCTGDWCGEWAPQRIIPKGDVTP